ncbi:DUF99 family protein [Halorubrum gandharaense]
MKSGSRTLGVAFSDGDETSRLAGAVVRADGTLDGMGFEACTVGGTDATNATIRLFERLEREDVQHVLCAGVAPAWFNLLDLHRIREAVERPTLAVSYEASDGLAPALRDAFEGDTLVDRLTTYRSLPPRRRVRLDGGCGAADSAADDERPLYVRAVGMDDERAAELVRTLTHEGFRRPEPVRVARIAAGAHRAAVERAEVCDHW